MSYSSDLCFPFRPTCDLYDEYLDLLARVPTLHWKSYGKQKQFCGYAVTVKCFEDNSRVKELVETSGDHNKVLVIDGGASLRCALLGDMLAENAVHNNWAGIVVHGCVRDVDALAQLNIGIQALGNTPRKSTRRGEGVTNIPVQIGNVLVNPGDLVFADNDGVLFLAPESIR
jgi:regulator of ribonuclease activity A